MQELPTDRAYIEVTEAITWIAFGRCTNAAAVLRQSVLDCKEHDRWDGWCLEDLQAYLEHVVEGAELDEAKHGPAREWQQRVEHLRRNHEMDDRGLLDKLRPYRAKRDDDKARIDQAERQLLEAARAEKLQILGTPVPRGAQPDGAADPEPVPLAYLLKPVAVFLSNNRLTCDWDADISAIRGWKTDYADLRAKTADVARLWLHGGAQKPLDAASVRAFDRTVWDYPMLLTWVYLRDPEQVEQAADYARTPLKLELLASMRRADPDSGLQLQFATCWDAEVDILNNLQSGALTALGLENGNGDAKEVPKEYWATAKVHWDGSREAFAGPADKFQRGATRWSGLRFGRAPVLALWPISASAKKGHASASPETGRRPDEPTILFLTLARDIGADPTHGRTIDDNVAQLLRDAVLSRFAPGSLGWNAHETLRRFDPEEYPRHAVRPVTADGKLVGYVPDEAPTFAPITSVEIVYCLAEDSHSDALAALDLPEAEMLRRVAEAALPPDGSPARLFIESLTISVREARRFCRRHSLPIPESLRESPVSWSEKTPIDAITVAELPHMPMAEVARRWAQELGEHGTGEDMIRRTIWRAFWRGDLARKEGLIIPLNAEGSHPEHQLERFTRAKLLRAFMTAAPNPLPFALDRTPQTSENGHLTDVPDADYRAVADRWDDVVRRMESRGWRETYIDSAMIERDPLLAWCERTGRSTPRFWERRSSAGSIGAPATASVTETASQSEPIALETEPARSERDWRNDELPVVIRAELWLLETIRAGWSGTFEAWYWEMFDAGFDIPQRQFRELWDKNATDEMRKPGPKTKNMPKLPLPR